MMERVCNADYVSQDFTQKELSFFLKKYDPPRNRYSKCWTHQRIKQEVLTSSRLKTLIAELSLEEGIERKEYELRVEELVDEIGHKLSIWSVKTVATLVRRPLHRVVQSINIKRKGLEELQSVVTQWPVVLLPSHRSYLDFLLISYFMLDLNIQVPAIAAGQDFMNMQFISALLRRSGAFFLRRTFGSDRLYKLVFTLYTQAVLCSGDTPMEFFIEGTRSRVAKSLHPKLGLLSMIVEPYLNGAVPDIMLFPLSISYEKTFEEDLFARELLGIPKPKESTSGLMRAHSLLSSDYGRIFIDISSPISLHELCQKWSICRISHGLCPRDLFSLTANERSMVTKLGYLVLERVNSGLRVFPSAILSAIILQHPLGIISKDELMRQAMWLKEEVELRGAPVEWPGNCSPVSVVDYSLSLLGYPDPQNLYLVKLPPPSDLSRESIMAVGFLHLKLAHYRNQLLYWFLPESLCLSCLLSCNELPILELKKRFITVTTTLAREFVFPQIPIEELFSDVVQALQDRGYISKVSVGDGGVECIRITTDGNRGNAAHFIGKLIQPFITGVWVLTQYLSSLRGGVQTMKSTFKNAQSLAVDFISKGIINSYEPLSLDMMKNAMASLDSAGLILHLDFELEGRGRLVKVAHEEQFQRFITDLELILFNGVSARNRELSSAPSKL